jgi:uncharacterized protein YxeA
MKSKIIIIAVVTVIASLIVAFFVNSKIIEMQNQINILKSQNDEVKEKLNDYKDQISDLQLQNREQHDRLCDFTYELAKARYVKVEISDFVWIGGFNPVGGLLLGYPVNVTIQNNDVVPLSGLKLRVLLVRESTGVEIGFPGGATIERLNAGEKRVIRCEPWASLNTSIDNSVMVTLGIGDIILDRETFIIS